MAQAEAAPSKAALRTGWILSTIPSLMLLAGAINALFIKSPQMMEGLQHLGYTDRILLPIGLLELVCPLLFLIPRTSVLGAILLTGFFGGAVATHLRIGEAMWIVPVFFGILTWAGILLRTPRLRVFLPFTN